MVDHHHLARALHEEGVEHVLVSVIAEHQGKGAAERAAEYVGWLKSGL